MADQYSEVQVRFNFSYFRIALGKRPCALLGLGMECTPVPTTPATLNQVCCLPWLEGCSSELTSFELQILPVVVCSTKIRSGHCKPVVHINKPGSIT